MKAVLKIILSIAVISSGIYGFLLYENNRAADRPGREKLSQSYEKAVAWLLNHRQEILMDANPALWSMLGESASISGDERVKKLYEEFRQDYDRSFPYSIWQAYFHPEQFRNAKFSASEYIALVEYQQYFLYGLTCSEQLAKEPFIRAQHSPGFCWSGSRTIRPACVTHQLMAFEMIKRNGCGVMDIDAKISALQDTIEKQLTYDPRVVDVYLQRVLMLVESGARNRVKSRWLRRVIDAQREDGGWSDVQPLVVLGGGRNLGFGANGFTFANPASNFHATAQGVLLMSLLKE
ncbi:MAG TPA: hypothetical protein VFM32_02630 [Spongiibacteraceae bacterium]|nr:hypothetical protein [Spongiibacteraceae bacterium]